MDRHDEALQRIRKLFERIEHLWIILHGGRPKYIPKTDNQPEAKIVKRTAKQQQKVNKELEDIKAKLF